MRYPSRAAGSEMVKMPYLQLSNSLFKYVHQSFVKPSVSVFERVGDINSQEDKTEEKYWETEGVGERERKRSAGTEHFPSPFSTSPPADCWAAAVSRTLAVGGGSSRSGCKEQV